MVLRRGNERMLTEVVFTVWPSLDGKPFRQRADKYSPPDSVAFRVNGAVQRRECSFGGKISGTGRKEKLGKTC